MSIIADTLTRLQAERPRRPDQPRSSVTPDSEKAADFEDLDFSSPPIPSRALGNRLPFLLVVLGGVGIAVYLWGLPFLAAPDKVMPKQEKVKAAQSAKPVPSGIVESIPEQREEPPVVTTTDKREDSDSTGPASVSDPPPASPDAGNARIRKPDPSPGVPFTAKPPPTRHTHSVHPVNEKTGVPHGFGMPLPLKSNSPAHNISSSNSNTRRPSTFWNPYLRSRPNVGSPGSGWARRSWG